MNYIFKKEEPKRPKIKWYHWIPIIGYFTNEYPYMTLGLDIWQYSWFMTLLILTLNQI